MFISISAYSTDTEKEREYNIKQYKRAIEDLSNPEIAHLLIGYPDKGRGANRAVILGRYKSSEDFEQMVKIWSEDREKSVMIAKKIIKLANQKKLLTNNKTT